MLQMRNLEADVACANFLPPRSGLPIAASAARMENELLNHSGEYIGDIMAHKPTKTVGVVVLQEHSPTKNFNDSSFTLRTAEPADRTYLLNELRAATKEEKDKFRREIAGKPGFDLVN